MSTKGSISDSAIVKAHWEREADAWEIGRGNSWLEHTAVRARINRLVSGRPEVDPYMYLIEYLKRTDRLEPPVEARPHDARSVDGPRHVVQRSLSLGCGAGELERGLSTHHFSTLYDAVDIAEGAIDIARRRADQMGLEQIRYKVTDVNHIDLPADTYDVVFGVMAIHHIERLEHLFDQVRKTLKKGGVFFLNEFVGPTRFQWTERQVEFVDRLLSQLPKKYRKTRKGRVKRHAIRPTVAQMKAGDPSEAVRSAELLPVLSSRFDILERKDYGGTILNPLLEGIAFNFDPGNEKDMTWMNYLFAEEDRLLSEGEITSDFSVILAG